MPRIWIYAEVFGWVIVKHANISETASNLDNVRPFERRVIVWIGLIDADISQEVRSRLSGLF